MKLDSQQPAQPDPADFGPVYASHIRSGASTASAAQGDPHASGITPHASGIQDVPQSAARPRANPTQGQADPHTGADANPTQGQPDAHRARPPANPRQPARKLPASPLNVFRQNLDDLLDLAFALNRSLTSGARPDMARVRHALAATFMFIANVRSMREAQTRTDKRLSTKAARLLYEARVDQFLAANPAIPEAATLEELAENRREK